MERIGQRGEGTVVQDERPPAAALALAPRGRRTVAVVARAIHRGAGVSARDPLRVCAGVGPALPVTRGGRAGRGYGEEQWRV